MFRAALFVIAKIWKHSKCPADEQIKMWCACIFYILSIWISICCYSVAKSCLTLCDPMDYSTPGSSVLHHLPRVWSNSWPLSQWCYLTISSSTTLFSCCQKSFPSSGSFPMSWLLTSAGQSIGASASTSVLPMNIQGWFPLGLTGLISLQSKGLLRVFSSTTVQKYEFFDAQPPLWSNCLIHTWLLEKP